MYFLTRGIMKKNKSIKTKAGFISPDKGDLILGEIREVKSEVNGLKSEMKEVKTELHGMKESHDEHLEKHDRQIAAMNKMLIDHNWKLLDIPTKKDYEESTQRILGAIEALTGHFERLDGEGKVLSEQADRMQAHLKQHDREISTLKSKVGLAA